MAVLSSNDSDFDTQLSENRKVVVKFYADWCGSCKLFSPKFKRHASAEDNDGILFLDVNAEENEAVRKLAGVDNLPFLASFYEGALLDATATSKEEKLAEMILKLKAKDQAS